MISNNGGVILRESPMYAGKAQKLKLTAVCSTVDSEELCMRAMNAKRSHVG